MNTDNMLLSGETIDYGPCAFMDAFQADKVFSSIDHGGRYAYRNQPGIAHWNLACLAQCLLPLLHEDKDTAVALAQEQVDRFPALFQEAYRPGAARKLGLAVIQDGDDDLVEALFSTMDQHRLDFTLTFRRLADLADEQTPAPVGDLFELPDALVPWLARWRDRAARETTTPAERQAGMYRANPVFIPRNHLVEEAIEAATREDDLAPFRQLAAVLQAPFDYRPEHRRFAEPPRPEQEVRQTFCGT
jgi:uncharacterized protein YdiU (UPF0061 family)